MGLARGVELETRSRSKRALAPRLASAASSSSNETDRSSAGTVSTETGEIFEGPFAAPVGTPSPHRASPGAGDALSGETPRVAGVGDVPANSKVSSREGSPDAPDASGNASRERADRARSGGVSSFAAHETLSATSAGSSTAVSNATPTIARV